MTTVGKKVVLGMLRLLQLTVFTIVATLEYLADKKMGVMRYLVFKNAYYEEGFLKTPLGISYKFVLVILLVTVLIGLLYVFIKRKERQLTGSIVSIGLITLICYILIFFQDALRLKAYYFFLMAFLAMLVIEFLRLLIRYR